MSMYDEMRYGDGISFARLPGQSLSIAGRGRTIGRGEIDYFQLQVGCCDYLGFSFSLLHASPFLIILITLFS